MPGLKEEEVKMEVEDTATFSGSAASAARSTKRRMAGGTEWSAAAADPFAGSSGG